MNGAPPRRVSLDTMLFNHPPCPFCGEHARGRLYLTRIYWCERCQRFFRTEEEWVEEQMARIHVDERAGAF